MKGIFLAASLGLLALGSAHAADFSFGRPTRLTLARNSASNVAIGDANGDGLKDVAATAWLPSENHELSLFVQRPDGSLSSATRLALPYGTTDYPLAFIDLDHDGRDEIVVGTGSGLTVTRLGATGALSVVGTSGNAGCVYLVTGDVDSDGNPDVICHDWQRTATVFYGDGVGAFRSTMFFQTPAGTYDQDFKTLKLADVTGDGRPDLLVTASNVNSFFVFPNDGFGGFWPATVYPHPYSPRGVWPSAIEVLDIDHDGTNEVVTASPDNQPDSMLNVYRRDANGYLALSERIPVYDAPTALLAGDVDGDGDTELLAGHFSFNTLTLVGAGGAGLSNQARFDLPGFGVDIYVLPRQGHSNGIALGDINHDGCNDVASATYSGVLLLYGCRPFASRVPVSDFDGDGVGDLMWRYDAGSENMLWESADIHAWYDCIENMPYPIGTCPSNMLPGTWIGQSGDFDGDGNSDVFWRTPISGANQVWDRGRFPRDVALVSDQYWQVVGAGDFDGDDRSDIVWRNARTGADAIWKSANASTQQPMTAVTDLGWKIVGVGDFDGDGHSDVLWRHASTGRNVIWRSGRYDSQQAVTAVTNVQWRVVGIGDFNGDGRDDIVWRNATNGADTIWLSANAATSKVVATVTDPNWTIAAVADYNGDGRSDLFWRNVSTGVNIIWLGANTQQRQAVETMDVSLQVVR